MFLLGIVENLIGLAKLHQVPGPSTVCGIHVQEAGLIRDPLSLPQVVGGNGVAVLTRLRRFHEFLCMAYPKLGFGLGCSWRKSVLATLQLFIFL